jgi:hypothetical protein
MEYSCGFLICSYFQEDAVVEGRVVVEMNVGV